jgi:glycosyltransferase involved in cell wall biosynthesis
VTEPGPAGPADVRIVCGPIRLPVDGIRDYADRLASSIREQGTTAEVDHERPDARPAPLVVVQYNPFSYGKRGFAPWLPRSIKALRRTRPETRVCLLVHERYVPPLTLRWALMGAWQRWQLGRLLRELASVRRDLKVLHLPVGSNLPDMRAARAEERERNGFSDDTVVLATFGGNHPSRRMDHVVAAANGAVRVGESVAVLNLGADAPDLRGLDRRIQTVQPGWLDAASVASLLSSADLFVAAFVDGVSSRRGTLMSALQHGLPVIGTDGRLTDQILRHSSPALTLVPVDSPDQMAHAARSLVTDAKHRRTASVAARRLYEDEFDWPVLVSRLLEYVR